MLYAPKTVFIANGVTLPPENCIVEVLPKYRRGDDDQIVLAIYKNNAFYLGKNAIVVDGWRHVNDFVQKLCKEAAENIEYASSLSWLLDFLAKEAGYSRQDIERWFDDDV